MYFLLLNNEMSSHKPQRKYLNKFGYLFDPVLIQNGNSYAHFRSKLQNKQKTVPCQPRFHYDDSLHRDLMCQRR
jgi:hypothetical protein